VVAPARDGGTVANPSKAKGSQFETFIVRCYRAVGGRAERASTNLASWDIKLPFLDAPVEVKRRTGPKLMISEWIRNLKVTARINAKWYGGDPKMWVLHIGGGDLRSPDAIGRITILPNELYFELIRQAYGSDSVRGQSAILTLDSDWLSEGERAEDEVRSSEEVD